MTRMLALVVALTLILATAGSAEPAVVERTQESALMEADPTAKPAIVERTQESPLIEADPAAEAGNPSGEERRSVRFDAASVPYTGVWVFFDDGFQLYLPGAWRAFDISDEEARAGLFFRAGNDGGGIVGDLPMGVATSYARLEGVATPEELLRELRSEGFVGLEALDVNGVPAVRFQHSGGDYRGLAFCHPIYPGYALYLYVAPVGEAGDAARAVGDGILSSLSPWSPATE